MLRKLSSDMNFSLHFLSTILLMIFAGIKFLQVCNTFLCFNHCRIMDKLPDEILLNIFSKLPLPDLISGARLTCWRWYHLSKDLSLWTTLDLSAFRCPYNDTDARIICNGVRNLLHSIQDSLECLTFSNMTVDGGVYELFGSSWKHKNKAKFSNLKSLDYSYSTVSPRNLRVALTTHPDIEKLSLSYTKISFSQAMEEAIHLQNLKMLIYHDSQSWDSYMVHHPDEGRFINKLNAMKVPKHCPLLEVVELHTIRADLDDEVIEQFALFCTNLKKLSFTWSANLTEDAFLAFNNPARHITELGLLDRQETGPYLHYVLPNFPHLRHLTVNGQNVYLEDCVAIGEFCPKLQELIFEINGLKRSGGMFEYYLCKGNSLCGLELQKIVQKCKDLRKLHAPFSNIDDDSVIFLSEQCLYLEDVNFTQCHRLTNEALFALSKNAMCLCKANFQDTNIDHKYILSLVSKCRKLEEVIFDHKPVQDASGAEASVSSSVYSDDSQSQTEDIRESDTRLTFSYNEDIPFIDMTSSSEEFELQHVLLKSLSKTDSENSSHEESSTENTCIPVSSPVYLDNFEHFQIPWSHCHIKRLSFKYSTTKEQYLLDIFTRCPDLTYISLDGSTSLTNSLITTIAKSCPNLQTLSISCSPTQESKPAFGDEGLLALVKYCRNLELISFLYNRNITPVGLTALLQSLDGPLRSLETVSLCVGHGYACSISVVALHGLKHLTEQSKRQLKDVAATARSNTYMLLHLDFNKRKVVK